MGPLQCRRTAVPGGSTWTPSSSTSGPASRSTGSSGTRFGGRSWRGDCARGAGPLHARARRLARGRAEHRRVGLRPAHVGGLLGGVGGFRHAGLADPPRAPAERPEAGPDPRAGRRRRRPLAFVGPRPGDRRIRASAGPRWRPARAVPAACPRARRLPGEAWERLTARRQKRLPRDLFARVDSLGYRPGEAVAGYLGASRGSAARPTTSSSPPGCSRGST